MSNIVYDFLVLKCVNIQTREGMVISFMDIIWLVSFKNWLKMNMWVVFKLFIGVHTSIYTEFMGSFMLELRTFKDFD